MSKIIFVTGTNTEVGKTYVSGLILKKLNEMGKKAAYFKMAMSGNNKVDSYIIPGDAKFVKDISNISQDIEDMCPYVYERAYSPHLAAKYENRAVDMDVIENAFNRLCMAYDYIVVEGSGGIICPIRWDEEKIMLIDFIKKFDLSTVIVSNSGLGTINGVYLTNHYLKNKNVNINGIIFNYYEKDNIIHDDNVKMCEELTGVKVIAKIKDGDISLDSNVDVLEMFKR